MESLSPAFRHLRVTLISMYCYASTTTTNRSISPPPAGPWISTQFFPWVLQRFCRCLNQKLSWKSQGVSTPVPVLQVGFCRGNSVGSDRIGAPCRYGWHSENSGLKPPKSSIWDIGFSIIFTIHFGGFSPIFGVPPIWWSNSFLRSGITCELLDGSKQGSEFPKASKQGNPATYLKVKISLNPFHTVSKYQKWSRSPGMMLPGQVGGWR